MDGRFQTLLGAGSCHGLTRYLDRSQQQRLAWPRHVREKAMLDGVVLRTVRRIMGHTNFQTEAMGLVNCTKMMRGALLQATVHGEESAPCLAHNHHLDPAHCPLLNLRPTPSTYLFGCRYAALGTSPFTVLPSLPVVWRRFARAGVPGLAGQLPKPPDKHVRVHVCGLVDPHPCEANP